MEAENKTDLKGKMSFSSVTALVTGWTLDFMFVSLCRYFKEGDLDKFNDTLSMFEGISQSPSLKGELGKKVLISAFLARVMHGKQLDVQFEAEAKVMPLMSAAKVWADLKNSGVDENLFKTVHILLFVQSVAVCLENGKKSAASAALKWFRANLECPKNVAVPLSAIVTKNETSHPVLNRFSYGRLLSTIQSYVDAYLEQNPSDYLLQAATEMLQSSPDLDCSGDGSRSESVSKSTKKKEKKTKSAARSKRKLMSTKLDDLWKPETCKKSCVSLKRISQNELSHLVSKTVYASNSTESQIKKRKAPQKWTAKLDKYLQDGVRRHGQGKWSRILLDYDFEGRTGVMLKDRWRVLVRSHRVS